MKQWTEICHTQKEREGYNIIYYGGGKRLLVIPKLHFSEDNVKMNDH